MDVLFRLTLSTGTGLTVTVQAAVLPLDVLAVRVAVPTAKALKVQEFDVEETILIIVRSLLVHVIVLSAALSGLMVAVSVSFAPI